METQNEQIQDPNQLNLFEILTDEQQTKVNEFIEKQNKAIIYQQKENDIIEQLLIEAGFVKDKDYINNFTIKTKTNKITLGYSWDKTNFTTEITYEQCIGNVKLITTYFDGKELKPNYASVYRDKTKLQCSSIQKQNRYIKPTTLLEQLKEYNQNQIYKYNLSITKTDTNTYTLEKYKTKYPKAIVTIGEEYNYGSRYSKEVRKQTILTIKFPSGSYVKFEVFNTKDSERLINKFDAQLTLLTTEELLDIFNNQI
jgi:hypothetical protein